MTKYVLRANDIPDDYGDYMFFTYWQAMGIIDDCQWAKNISELIEKSNDGNAFKCLFTLEEIKKMGERYLPFKVEVE